MDALSSLLSEVFETATNSATSTLIAALVSTGIIWARRRVDPHKHHKETLQRFEFISAFLAFDVTRRSPFLVEQAFSYYLGSTVSFREILAILKLTAPSEAFSLWAKCGGLIQLDFTSNSFAYDKRYSSAAKRSMYGIITFSAYMLLSTLSFIPLVVLPFVDVSPEAKLQLVLGTALWTVVLFGMAFKILLENDKLRPAERFMEIVEASEVHKVPSSVSPESTPSPHSTLATVDKKGTCTIESIHA